MKILFLTKYNDVGPSSRYRVYQYLKFYTEYGFKVEVSPLFGSWFFHKIKIFRNIAIPFYYIRRFLKLFQLGNYNLACIEYELFPFLPAVFERLLRFFDVNYIVEYDDAIFHNYNDSSNFFIRLFLSKKIDYVIRNANYVIGGSPYLSKYISLINSKYIEIPTSISQDKYVRLFKENVNEVFIVGWIGSVSTSVNLIKLIPVFEALNDKINFQLNLIGFDKNLFSKLQHLNVNFIEWRSETEIEEMSKFDVGIMPLDFTLFNQGKCGFKLVQYMGCSLPTISTPLEANVKMNRNKKNLHALTVQEWISAIECVYENQKYFREVGLDNYKSFVKYYSVENNVGTYIAVYEKFKKINL